MRRIPRPQRAIDPSLRLPSISRPQPTAVSSLRVASPYSHIRTPSASFSTTPTLSFILGKQDKKKHQAFVRRWQKRLLGDSEPIGAHVDPYDPTSPVRIAPEEQGEEVEVLEEAALDELKGMGETYEEAETWHQLRHVGGKQWIEQIEESKLAKEFEKLTLRTYTPLDPFMADQIEDLTGSMYTLRDENLMMATVYNDFMGMPYTKWSFGRYAPLGGLDFIRENFHRAVTEVFALKQAGKLQDISRLPNQGIYEAPEWIKEATLQMSANADVVLSLPSEGTLDELLEEMFRVPVWKPEQQQSAQYGNLGDSEADLFEEPVPPVMDPETPAFKRTALAKQDPEKRFDFMSNRPVPRSQPQTPIAQPAETAENATKPKSADGSKEKAEETTVEAADTPTQVQSRIEMLEASTSASEESIAVLQQAVHDRAAALPRKFTDQDLHSQRELKWRDVPLVDLRIKFVLAKRVTQLTGLHIADPNLTAAHTLGELYHHFCVASEKPKVSKVYDFIQIEGGRQNFKTAQLADPERASTRSQANRPTVGELLKLGNVAVYKRRPTAQDERKMVGLYKAIGRELKQRDLLDRDLRTSSRQENTRTIEGTQRAPQPGTVVALGAAHVLKERTIRRKREVLDA